MSDAPTHTNGNGSMGLAGTWRQIANLSAVAVVCAVLWVIVHAMLAQAQASQEAWFIQVRQDRELVRQELDRIHEGSRRQWEAIQSLARSVQDLTAEVRRCPKEPSKP